MRLLLACALSSLFVGGWPVAAQDGPAGESAGSPRLVQAAGYTLNVVVTKGATALPTIILESGGGGGSRQWTSLQPRLAAATSASVVSYDQPGFGKSPLPSKPYDIVQEADALRQAVTAMGLGRRVVLVGHSYGAFLVQLWASRSPETLAARSPK